jgi:hypothetical protein
MTTIVRPNEIDKSDDVCPVCGKCITLLSIYHKPSTRSIRYNIEQDIESEEEE